MKKHPYPIIDEELSNEISLSEARRQAKDMACIKYCGDGIKTKGSIHVIACPYWNPFKKGVKHAS